MNECLYVSKFKNVSNKACDQSTLLSTLRFKLSNIAIIEIYLKDYNKDLCDLSFAYQEEETGREISIRIKKSYRKRDIMNYYQHSAKNTKALPIIFNDGMKILFFYIISVNTIA